MSETNLFQKICQIYQTNQINSDLIKELSLHKEDSNYTMKKYLLDFLYDINNNEISLNKNEDFWFIKEKLNNKNIILKYVNLIIDAIQNNKKINGIEFCSHFFDTDVENKIVLIYLILDKFGLHDTIITLFVGFILGDNKDFIKRNYFDNIYFLLKIVEPNLIQLKEDMPIFNISEKILEIINIYLYIHLNKNENIEQEEEENNEDNENIEQDEDENIENEENIKQEEFEKQEEEKLKGDKEDLIKIKNSLFDINIFEKLDINIIYERFIDSNEFDIIFDYIDKELETDRNIKFKKVINSIKKNIINNISLKKKKKADIILISHFVNINKENKENKEISESEAPNISKTSENTNFIIHKNSKNRELNQNEHEDIIYNNKIDNNKFKNTIINTYKNEIIENNKSSNSQLNNINVELYTKQKEDENINNQIYKEGNSFKENDNNTNESSSINIKNKINYIKLNKISEYVNYPQKEDLKKILGENNEKFNTDFVKLLRAYNIANILREKVRDFCADLKNEFFKIEKYIEKINLECDIKKLEITNSRLEILIDFFRNPNFLLLKRRIIDIFLFNLYKSKNDLFQLPENYMPDKVKLEELEKLIERKEIKNEQYNEIKIKKDKDMVNNYKKIINQDNKEKINHKNKFDKKDQKINKINLYNQYHVIEDFLESYKKNLDQIIYYSYDKPKNISIPGLFKTDIEKTKFLSDIGYDKNEEKKFNNKNNNNNQVEIDKQIFTKNKFLSKDIAVEVLFSEDLNFNYLDDNIIKTLNLNNDNIKGQLSNINQLVYSMFKIDFSPPETAIHKEDAKQIEILIKNFYEEVIISIDEFYNYLIQKNKIDSDDEKYILIIKTFIQKYIENCNFVTNWDKIYDSVDMYYLYSLLTKLANLEKIQILLNDKNMKINELLKRKELEILENIEKMKKSINVLKEMVKEQNSENEIIFYKNWLKKSKSKYKDSFKNFKKSFSFTEIKKILKEIIEGDTINIEMKYAFDNNFCLWVIKNNLEEYYY